MEHFTRPTLQTSDIKQRKPTLRQSVDNALPHQPASVNQLTVTAQALQFQSKTPKTAGYTNLTTQQDADQPIFTVTRNNDIGLPIKTIVS